MEIPRPSTRGMATSWLPIPMLRSVSSPDRRHPMFASASPHVNSCGFSTWKRVGARTASSRAARRAGRSRL